MDSDRKYGKPLLVDSISKILQNFTEVPKATQTLVRDIDFTSKTLQSFYLFYLSVNYENREGAVGFVSVLFPSLLPLGLIKVNAVTGHEIRDENGLCIRCEPGEPGEFVGQIVKNHPVRDFDGYADQSATKKKILRNVWRHGDMCFRSGDILIMDQFGWLYFKDRSGDTFRWRGENVSTTEVEATVSNMVQLRDAVVYGVEASTF